MLSVNLIAAHFLHSAGPNPRLLKPTRRSRFTFVTAAASAAQDTHFCSAPVTASAVPGIASHVHCRTRTSLGSALAPPLANWLGVRAFPCLARRHPKCTTRCRAGLPLDWSFTPSHATWLGDRTSCLLRVAAPLTHNWLSCVCAALLCAHAISRPLAGARASCFLASRLLSRVTYCRARLPLSFALTPHLANWSGDRAQVALRGGIPCVFLSPGYARTRSRPPGRARTHWLLLHGHAALTV